MSVFNRVIGYESVKRELTQLCDMLKNQDRYTVLGAKMPKGLLLYGEPGIGKSLMARCFVEDLGWTAFMVRRDSPNGDFVRELSETFQQAAESEPSIIVLEDMDKFAVVEGSKEEYVAVQAGIDAVAGKRVYVIATVNDIDLFPRSLLRAGRFDKKIEVQKPSLQDSEQIIQHYLSTKPLGDTVEPTDVARMLVGKTCAELETLLNEAAIYAGAEDSDKVEMCHIVEAVLRSEYGVCDEEESTQEDRRMVAYHEAGHAVMQDLLSPDGVGIVSIRPRSEGVGGFMGPCAVLGGEMAVLTLLAGRAATELEFGAAGPGDHGDIAQAITAVRDLIMHGGVGGLHLVTPRLINSTDLLVRVEQASGAELERYMTLARKILAENREYLDAVAAELIERGTLLNSDMRRLREGNAQFLQARELGA